MLSEGSEGAHTSDANTEVTGWLLTHRSNGSILVLGGGEWAALADDDYRLVVVDHLASTLHYEAVFDHVWIGGGVNGDFPDLLSRAHRATKPGASALVVVPFGLIGQDPSAPAFYVSSVIRWLDPLFEVTESDLLGDQIGVVGRRRDLPNGTPTLSLDQVEEAFANHERRLVRRIRQLSAELAHAGARYRTVKASSEQLKKDLDRTSRELASLRRKVAPLKRSLALPLAILRRRHKQTTEARASAPPKSVTPAAPAQAAAAAAATSSVPAWREGLQARFQEWVRVARAAEGEAVIVMFSGTTYVQEQRGNRPIRLTNSYLGRNCPVFFNYYRWNTDDALPEHPDQLLFQSPIDVTPSLMDALLTADYGGKRKIFFASFPHEIMVRQLTLAAQLGWVTIYDARDDWEEFAKVGMAKWYDPGYERYVTTHADIVTAVSRPLARKMSALAGGRLVHVSANALDVRFPRPSRPRHTAGKPVVGYFGHLTDKWFDWPLVIAAARRYPQITFELAGHQQPNVDLPPNIKLLGLLGHKELAERSVQWALALIPFKNGPLADAVDPIKVYEYLHLGLPVLATYFPQCRDYPGTVITEGNEEFLQRLPQLVGTRLDEREIADWLAENTWERRVDVYSELAERVRKAGRSGSLALLGGL